MKLIIKEYLASLRERGELDAVLPDLLSQMGLNVFISPSRGVKEYGVDIAAVGKIEDEAEKVYLFSVKSGNLTHDTWNGAASQSLRPSLDQIIDAFIPSRIPSKHKGKPIEIILCFGGDVHSGIRQEVSGYTNRNTRDNISFDEWNGDRLAGLIEQYFMREDLAPEHVRSRLRKALAMLDEPEISFKHFKYMISNIYEVSHEKTDGKVTGLRQILIYNWILYSWCRDAGNLESAYLASEYSLLISWELFKSFIDKKIKPARSALLTFNAIFQLYIEVSNKFIDKFVPHSGCLHAISKSISPSCPADVNLKLFDLIGRMALRGLWMYWFLQRTEPQNVDRKKIISQNIYAINDCLIKTINNNPMLFTPYKDDQAIDIVLALWFMALDPKRNRKNLHGWLGQLMQSCFSTLNSRQDYPSMLSSYSDLIRAQRPRTDEYFQSITKGSILYPFISIFAAIFNFKDIFDQVVDIKGRYLKHCNFQIYFFDETSEQHLYLNSDVHGAILSHVTIDKGPEVFLDEIIKECEHSTYYYNLTASQVGFWPIVLMACRHYRLPIPIHLLIELHKHFLAPIN